MKFNCTPTRLAFAVAGLGLLAGHAGAQTSSSKGTNVPANAPTYEVASIRQNMNPTPRWNMYFTSDGFHAMDVTLDLAIKEAYGIYDGQLWSGWPAWIDQRRFDIEAKFDVAQYPQIALEQRRAMLQQLLADRFKLVVHHDAKEFPLYALVVVKDGTKLQETKPEDVIRGGPYGAMCLHERGGKGLMKLKGCSMADLAFGLSGEARSDLGRKVIDQTGLTGRYTLTLQWTPESESASDTLDTGGPFIFTALKEQLGLELKPIKGPLDTIVIDHVEMPTEN